MNILIQFAHPVLHKSRVNKQLINAAYEVQGVLVNDLYEIYPDFNIDVKREQELLLKHDMIIFQHPFYWYSSPSLLKEWQDLVLEHDFAYGSKGNALHGKYLFSTISTGGNADSYQPNGYNQHSMKDMLIPFKQTANLCGMTYLPPFLVQGTHSLAEGKEIKEYAGLYKRLLEKLQKEEVDLSATLDLESLNEIL